MCSGLGSANIEITVGISYKPSNGQRFRSGNPGYLFGSPVLVKEGNSIDKNGFRLFSDDSKGNCFSALSKVNDYEYSLAPLLFGSN